jgi:hypothetical protein
MDECLKTCGYNNHPPNLVQVKNGSRADAWIKELKQQLNEGVQMVVLILPGQKGKCTLYDDVKRFLLESYPIPSQVILTATIQRGKNLRSIISKVLI